MSAPGSRPRQRSAAESSLASREKITSAQDYTMPPTTISKMVRHFDPCVATADMFLYAQGNSVVCCHHDTLAIERRFSRHPDEVLLLAVDNMSERGAGRLVVSYDASQNAIVWDIMTGNEVARFASFSNLTAATWMRNGAVAFGNDSGTIILFEPETSEHISFRTIDQIAVTALAPAADCRTFAIGYQNGSLLICQLQPRFTILHNLTTSRGPSPIVGLSWHASSARQRSDMLAVQTYDGDLRVWSVAKSHHASEPAKVVRNLERTENYIPGPNWMNWSKNGRIIQYSESQTLSWDVRTKHVTHDSIPTADRVRGLAVYGPGASLFTLGQNNTVQQYDLNAPAFKVADVQHPANLLPPSPPVSIEEQERKAAEEAAEAAEVAAAAGAMSETESAVTRGSTVATTDSSISIQLDGGVSESDDDHLSPFARMQNATHIQAIDDFNSDLGRTISPAPSQGSELSSRSGHSSQTPNNYPRSMQSRALTEHTYMSVGSSLKSSALSNINQQYQPQHSSRHPSHKRQRSNMPSAASGVSGAITSTTFSTNNSSRTGASRPSRLRNEVPRSPDDAKVYDLFKFTRSRLTDVPYRMPPSLHDRARLTNDDLRRQMLQTVFGWTEDVEDLIRDEMNRYPANTANRILLAKWLGDIDPDIITASSETMTSSDWMLLALSGIGSQASQHKMGRAYIQRLLESGDLNAAATIMIGMGDHNDAIEIYASHHKYMEALLVAGLFYPSVWERQSHLIKKWGEWAIKNGQRELAIRCATSTDKESTEPWTSPSAAQITFPSIHQTVPELLSPPLSPPSVMQRGPQRSVAKSSALRLITNFGDDARRAKFYSNQEGEGATPIAAGVTPIVDSAISPAVGGGGDMTAFIRPSQRSVFNTPSTSRSTTGFGRQRLASIGETPNDANHPRNILKGVSATLDDHPGQAAEIPRASSRNTSTPVARAMSPPVQMQTADNTNFSIGLALQRASTSSPLYRRKEPREPPLPSPSPASLAVLMDGRNSRNGPRNRIPLGLDLSIGSIRQVSQTEATSPERTGVSTNRYRWPTRRRGPGSVSSSVTSNSSVYGSRSNRFRTDEAPSTGKTLDDYINSIDAAKTRDRKRSKERRQRSRESSRNRRPSVGSATPSASSVITVGTYPLREQEADSNWASSRGFTSNKSGKRSPRSPVPMSPEDLISLSTPRMFGRDDIAVNTTEDVAPLTVRKASSSSQQHVEAALPSSKSRPSSRTSSRGRMARGKSPEPRAMVPELPRGRNTSRTASAVRSPSSPLPFTNSEARGIESEEDEADLRKAVEEKERFRSRDRTSSRTRASSKSRRDNSPGSANGRDRTQRRRPTPAAADHIDRAATASTSRNHRATAGPPPAPSALAVASGVGLGIDRASATFNSQHSQQAAGEELGRRRTQSAMSERAHRGELRQISRDERAERKAAAARELENRRKSLVRHPMAPPIMHPDYLSPGLDMTIPEIREVSMPPMDLPIRSQTVEPDSMSNTSSSHMRTRSMFASRSSTTIGLPATPKAMRLVLEPGAGASAPEVPPIPSGRSYFQQQQQQHQPQHQQDYHKKQAGSSSGKSSPEAGGSPNNSYGFQPAPTQAPAPVARPAKEETLTLLPSTVYQPPTPSRGAIPRSMSAPPQELFFNTGPMSQGIATPRKTGRSSSKASISGEDFQLGGTLTAKTYRRPSLDDLIPPPPPPPPAPPMLKELAHLAVPPPPPPAPLPFGSMGGHNAPVVYGGHTSGTIEVVMDDDDEQPAVTVSQPYSSQYAGVPPPPPPPPAPSVSMETLSASRSGHQRGRSSTDNSIAGRISRATERMRSASRGPNNASVGSRIHSPEMLMSPYESIPIPQSKAPEMAYAPYESVPGPGSMSFSARSSPPQQQQVYQQQMRTGLHQSEMI